MHDIEIGWCRHTCSPVSLHSKSAIALSHAPFYVLLTSSYSDTRLESVLRDCNLLNPQDFSAVPVRSMRA